MIGIGPMATAAGLLDRRDAGVAHLGRDDVGTAGPATDPVIVARDGRSGQGGRHADAGLGKKISPARMAENASGAL